MANIPTQKDALAPSAAARRLGIGRTTIYQLLAAGDLRSFKIGRARRIPAEDVEALRRTSLAASQTNHGPQTCRCALAFFCIARAFAACHNPTAGPLFPASVVGEKPE